MGELGLDLRRVAAGGDDLTLPLGRIAQDEHRPVAPHGCRHGAADQRRDLVDARQLGQRLGKIQERAGRRRLAPGFLDAHRRVERGSGEPRVVHQDVLLVGREAVGVIPQGGQAPVGAAARPPTSAIKRPTDGAAWVASSSVARACAAAGSSPLECTRRVVGSPGSMASTYDGATTGGDPPRSRSWRGTWSRLSPDTRSTTVRWTPSSRVSAALSRAPRESRPAGRWRRVPSTSAGTGRRVPPGVRIRAR